MDTHRLTFDIATNLDPSVLLELLHEHAGALADDIGSQHDGYVRSDAADIEQSCCVEPVPTVPTEPVTVRIQRIVDARDFNAEHGSYPVFPAGPGEDQCFDDWAADVAGEALKLNGYRLVDANPDQLILVDGDGEHIYFGPAGADHWTVRVPVAELPVT